MRGTSRPARLHTPAPVRAVPGGSQDNRLDNVVLRTIHPIFGGTADNIRRLKMQRLNAGFSRAKAIMVFVHSMAVGNHEDTRLGDALRNHDKLLNAAHDHYVADEKLFANPPAPVGAHAGRQRSPL